MHAIWEGLHFACLQTSVYSASKASAKQLSEEEDIFRSTWNFLVKSTLLKLLFLQPMNEPGSCLGNQFGVAILVQLMNEPVVAADGFTYERAMIEQWLSNGHITSPMTNAPLPHAGLVPNFALRSAIREWQAAHP